MKLIGLTGNIGSGKTTAASYLETKGYYVLSFDKLGKELLLPSNAVFQRLVATFGKEILTEAGRIDRKKLAYIAFQNEEKYKLLNHITHKAITQRAQEQVARIYETVKDAIVILDIPLLFESKKYNTLNFIVFISSKEEIREERLCSYRNFTVEEARMRMKKQMQEEEKIKRAQFVVYNNTTKEAMYLQLDKATAYFSAVNDCHNALFF